jgi:hypothetical protein
MIVHIRREQETRLRWAVILLPASRFCERQGAEIGKIRNKGGMKKEYALALALLKQCRRTEHAAQDDLSPDRLF